MVRAVRNIFTAMDGKMGLSLLAVNRVLERYNEPLVLPSSLRAKYDAMFELSTSQAMAKLGAEGNDRVICRAGEGNAVGKENMMSARPRTLPACTSKANGRPTLRQRLAVLDEEVKLLAMEKEAKDRKRGMLFGLLPKLW